MCWSLSNRRITRRGAGVDYPQQLLRMICVVHVDDIYESRLTLRPFLVIKRQQPDLLTHVFRKKKTYTCDGCFIEETSTGRREDHRGDRGNI